MNERNDERESAFERRTKELFDDSVAGLDAATRSRLNRARQRALEELAAPRRHWLWTLAPVGAVATAAAVAWLVVWQQAPQPVADVQLATLSDLEILLGEEDLEMLDEEIEFYGWLEEQPEFASADDNVG